LAYFPAYILKGKPPMDDALGPAETVEAPAVSAAARIKELKAAIPALDAEAERLQREILALAPECERGNVSAKGKRKKLRAELAELIDLQGDKAAAIEALGPAAANESDAARGARVKAQAARIQATFASRDDAAAYIDEALASLIGRVQEFNERGAQALARCQGLVPDNRLGWVTVPKIDHLILTTLAHALVIDREYVPRGLEMRAYSIREIAKADSGPLLGAVQEAAARESQTTAERAAMQAARLEQEAEALHRVDMERRQSGARYG
jgi:hypothetical protein